jgi:hypothetical protein
MISRVARPRWTPQTDDQRRAIAKAERAADRADNADADMWAAVTAARDLGVPPVYLAKKIRRGRATLYRHVPPLPKSDDE